MYKQYERVNYNDSVIISAYQGTPHSPDGSEPSVIQYGEGGFLRRALFHSQGVLHRRGDLPADIWMWDSDRVRSVEFYHYGKLAREFGKPHSVYFRRDGSISQMNWCVGPGRANNAVGILSMDFYEVDAQGLVRVDVLTSYSEFTLYIPYSWVTILASVSWPFGGSDVNM